MEVLAKIVGVVFIAFVTIMFVSALFAVITQWAWAGSVSQIFHLPDLTFMQAFWLNMLGGMVCKGSSSSSSK